MNAGPPCRYCRFSIILSLVFFRCLLEPNLAGQVIGTAADSVVTLNEIMYHPAGDDPALEWLELYNQMSVDMDISNWRVEGGIEFRFPTNSILAANGYLVVAANPSVLKGATGATNVFGPFAKRL